MASVDDLFGGHFTGDDEPEGTQVEDTIVRPSRREESLTEETVPVPIQSRQDGVVPIIQVRVKAHMRPAGAWHDVTLSLQMHADTPFQLLGTFWVARRKSGEREAPELMAIALLKNVLQAGGAEADLHGCETRTIGGPGPESVEYAWWATLSARLSVAVLPGSTQDARVQVIGLQ